MTSVLTEEDLALNKNKHQISHAIAIRLAGVEHRLDFCTIRKSHGRAGGVNGELVEQIAGKLAGIIGEDDL